MTTYQKAQLLKSMQKLDHEMRTRHYPAVLEADDNREAEQLREVGDAEEFFLAEQCPSDATFR